MALAVNFACLAQDVIRKTDGSSIKAIVKEINDSEVKYNRFDNPDGPLYVIPLSSIVSITYKNGSVDTFGSNSESRPSTEKSSAHPGAVDPYAPNYSSANEPQSAGVNPNSLILNQNGQRVSDAELLRIYGADGYTGDYKGAAYYKKKAKALQLTAWIGGGVIAGAGILTSLIMIYYPEMWGLVAAPMVGGAAIWTGCFLAGANHQMKKAKAAYFYSATMVEREVANFGENNLTAGINLLGNNLTHNRALGLGLSFNF